VFAFVLAVVFVFLVLAAQFESLTLPLAVILIVPMCLIASIVGVCCAGRTTTFSRKSDHRAQDWRPRMPF
jgi:multidrug efflux pump subunit AcrB